MYKYLTLLLLLPLLLPATSIKVSEAYGYDATDATQFLRQALGPNESADTVIIDNVGEWNTERLFVRRDNITILLEPGTVVTALAGAFENTNFKLFNIRDVDGVHFVGYGATIRMIPGVSFSEGDTGGFRHLLNFSGCNDISVAGLTLRDSGGDGIQVGQDFQDGGQKFCVDVDIRDCFIDNNYRQGISITGGRNVLIENCLITNTEGALPSSGIDFEPSNAEEVIQNCVVRNCRITDNAGRGIQNGFGKSDATTPPIEVTIEDTYIARNGTSNSRLKAGGITLNVGNKGITGKVIVRNVVIEDQPYDGLYLKSSPENVTVDLENVILRNVANFPDALNPDAVGDTIFRIARPVLIEPNFRNLTQPFGGVSFTDVVIEQDQDIEYFYAIGNNEADRTLKDITGDVTVISPFTPRAVFEQGGALDNVTLTATALTAWPEVITTLAAATARIDEGETGTFTLGIDTELDIPYPVYYTMRGTAENRLDYAFLPGLRVFPPTTTELPVDVVARVDAFEEEAETVVLDVDITTPGNATDQGCNLPPAATILLGGEAQPIQWGEVTATFINDCSDMEIRWTALVEENVGAYSIERRAPESASWRTVKDSIAPGAGSYRRRLTAAVNTVPGTTFRIRQDDLDGNYSYSGTVTAAVDNCGQAAAHTTVYPQPATDRIIIERETGVGTTVTISDLSGRTLSTTTISGFRSVLELDLQPGVYLLTVGERSAARRIVVQ